MKPEEKYEHLEHRPEKSSQELLIRGTVIRASTLWHDRYVSRQHPIKIAKDRDLPVEAVLEALAYCEDAWELICSEKDRERQMLQRKGFFGGNP